MTHTGNMPISSRDNIEKIRSIEELISLYTEHLNNVRSLFSQLTSYMSIIEKFHPEDNTLEIHEFKNQLDFSGFLTVCTLDILVTTKNLLQVEEIWEELYYLRHGYLTIYEAINTYNAHNKWIHSFISENFPGLKPEFDLLAKEIRQFKRDYNYDTTIAEIRNETTAHIDRNFLNYFDKMSGFNREKAVDALLIFIGILDDMQTLSKKISHEVGMAVGKRSDELNISIQKKINWINNRFKELNESLRANVR